MGKKGCAILLVVLLIITSVPVYGQVSRDELMDERDMAQSENILKIYEVSEDGKSVKINAMGVFEMELAEEIVSKYPEITSLTLGASVTGLYEEPLELFELLETISVDPNNKVYTTEDGILYNKALTTLVFIPYQKQIISYVCPDTVTHIEEGAINSDYLTTVTIGKNVDATMAEAGRMFGDTYYLTNINVNPENENFTAEDGVLYNKDKTVIVKYPTSKINVEFSLPSSVKEISSLAFDFTRFLESLKMNDGLTTINQEGFSMCSKLKTITIPKSLTNIGLLAFFGTKFNHITYMGTSEEWNKFVEKNIKDISFEMAIENAEIVFSEEVLSVSDNKPMNAKTVRIGENDITYNTEVPFFVGKASLESFGDIIVSCNGVSGRVTKAKINKKKHLIQIKEVAGFSKEQNKKIKADTKGSNGLSYKTNPYWVKNTDSVTIKKKRNGEIKSVKVQIGSKKYKAKKSEFKYNSATNTLEFSGNLAGSYQNP